MTILTPASSLSFRRKKERARYRHTRETLRTRVSHVIRVSCEAFVSCALFFDVEIRDYSRSITISIQFVYDNCGKGPFQGINYPPGGTHLIRISM